MKSSANQSKQDTGVGEERRGAADPSDVLVTVLGGEPEVGAQSVAQVVAVENVGRMVGRHQAALQRVGEGGLAGPRQSRQPNDRPLMAEQPGALMTRDLALLSGDVLGTHAERRSLGGAV